MTANRTFTLLAAGLLSLVTATGCVVGPSTQPPDSTQPTSAPPTADQEPSSAIPEPEKVVGNWKVTLAGENAADDIVLQFGSEMVIWHRCGHISGGYILTPSGRLLTDFNSGSAKCPISAPGWLPSTAQLEWSRDNLILADADDTPHATLELGGQPPLSKNYMDEFTHAPTLTDDLKQRLTWESVELPAGLLPASADLLLRNTWYPKEPDPQAPDAAYIKFTPDYRYEATDGCNGTAGAWWIEPNGSFKLTFGISTLIGCAGVDVISQFYTVAALATDADTGELVLLDGAGVEVARYVPRATGIAVSRQS
ncbi:Heat shock protein HslJ [Micrococcales bacterium KH10]|nr:Heat shock protein HslJ [Micrococcales bacterium KH10]